MLYSSRKTTFWKCQCEFFKLRKNLSAHVLTPYCPTPLKGLLSADMYCTRISQWYWAHVFPFSFLCFFPKDSLAAAVLKLTKWVSNKQKCHLSSWKCHTKQVLLKFLQSPALLLTVNTAPTCVPKHHSVASGPKCFALAPLFMPTLFY